MQRAKEEDPEITKKMKELIDGQIDNASHDFDKIKQAGCEHGKEKVLSIDVDKILGLKGDSGVSYCNGFCMETSIETMKRMLGFFKPR